MAESKKVDGAVPYLTIEGAGRAIEFYKQVLDAELVDHMMADDGKRFMHASLRINGAMVMLSDTFPEYGDNPPPDPGRGSPVAINLQYTDPGEVDRIYALALEKGGTSKHEPEDMFWGDRFAQFVDIVGHRWMLLAPAKPD